MLDVDKKVFMTINYYIIINETYLYNCSGKIDFMRMNKIHKII